MTETRLQVLMASLGFILSVVLGLALVAATNPPAPKCAGGEP